LTAVAGSSIAATSAKTLDSSPAAQNDRARQESRSNAPITVTGCLQRDGRTFIVTHQKEPAQKNSGSTGNGAAVEREQIRSAANAYRVSPAERMDLGKMVGKQIQVSGTIVKTADLPPATRSSDKREDIGKGDLAEIKATAVSIIGYSCGTVATGGRSPVAVLHAPTAHTAVTNSLRLLPAVSQRGRGSSLRFTEGRCRRLIRSGVGPYVDG